MSGLTRLLRRVTGGRWPRRSSPRLDRPHFDCYKRLGIVPGSGPASADPLSAEDLDIERFSTAPCYRNRLEHLRHALKIAPVTGYALEFGVYRGGSLNWLARWSESRPDPRVFGFDSFQGLPEDWQMSPAARAERGCFALAELPTVLANARLVPGRFEHTLPGWLSEHQGPVAFVHLDADLYSSTRFALAQLDARIVPGTVLVFDELSDWTGQHKYDQWREGEWRALAEWQAAGGRRIQVLSRTNQLAAAVRVIQ